MITNSLTFSDRCDETPAVGPVVETLFTVERFDQWDGQPRDKGARPCYLTRADPAAA